MLCDKCKDAPALEGKERCQYCEDDTIVGDERRYVKDYALGQVRNELEWAVKNITSPLITKEYRKTYTERIMDALKNLEAIKPNNEV